MEVHVWLNHYRVLNNNGINSLSEEHLYHKSNHLFVEYDGRILFQSRTG